MQLQVQPLHADSDYVPSRRRSLAVTFLISCQPLGGFIGGAICAQLVPASGWQSVFLLGLIWPLALLPWLVTRLPETIDYLAATEHGRLELASLSRQFRFRQSHGVVAGADAPPVSTDPEASWSSLVANGRARGSVLLWSTSALGVAMLYFLVSWLPTIFRNDGVPAAQAIGSSVALNAGSVARALLISWLMDRANPYRVVAVGYFLAFASIVVVMVQGGHGGLVMTMIFLTGFFGIGAQSSLTAIIVRFYPPAQHTIAVAAVLVLSRVGAIAGPLIGSYILLQGGQVRGMFTFAAVACLACGLSMTAMLLDVRGRTCANT